VQVRPEQIEPLRFDDGALLAFVNGRFAPSLSSIEGLPAGVRVMGLARAVERSERAALRHLAQHADVGRHPFAALNTAFLQDGAFVHVPRGTVLEQPLHLLFLLPSADRPVVVHPRVLIVADTDSQLQVVEQYAGLNGAACWTNAVTELIVGQNSVVRHAKVVREADAAWHIGHLHVRQDRSSTVQSHVVLLDGLLVRNEIHALLDGEGAHATLHGLYMLRGRQHVDNHLRIEHVKPHCDSREWFRGILDGASRGVFTGRIVVHPGAQKTDAKQSNMNLLLSPDALADSKPQLEIFADDVKCTHGATMGQVDDQAVFYLRSRGLNADAARGLLVYSFADACLTHLAIASLRQHLRRLVVSRLPHSDLLQGALET